MWTGKISNTHRVDYNNFIVTAWWLYLLYYNIHTHICMYIYSFVYACTCSSVCVHVCPWKPEVNFGCLHHLMSNLFFETGFHTEPRAQMIEWQAPEGLLSLPALCWYSRHVSTFWWVLELELRSSCLHDQHFTNELLLQFL